MMTKVPGLTATWRKPYTPGTIMFELLVILVLKSGFSMITSFHIKNFRVFKTLDIQRFGRVNLIVGKNNAGKTCLLEALWLYTGDVAPEILRSILTQREEFWQNKNESSDANHPIYHLFHQHKDSETIELFDCFLRHLEGVNEYEEECYGYDLKMNNKFPGKNTFVTEYAGPGGIIRNETLLSELTPYLMSEYRFTGKTHFLFTTRFVSKQIEILWDQIVFTAFEDTVIHALQLIDPEIDRFGLIRNHTKNEEIEMIPVVFRQGQRVPLRQLGDGMTHLFHIILALVNAQNGTLLIDEFENGLHWRIQPQIWALIFQLAEELKVQVFATTHSRDCVESFYEAWMLQADESIGSFLRLNNPPDKTVFVTEYPRKRLGNALTTDVEMR